LSEYISYPVIIGIKEASVGSGFVKSPTVRHRIRGLNNLKGTSDALFLNIKGRFALPAVVLAHALKL
jgi:hypothetical protein